MEIDMEKKYKTGYVPGVYDLFHIGHLNLLRRSKERCEYLIAGVLTDELVIHFKGKPPYIPYKERAEIVRSVRYVDEVVAVDFHNTWKMDAWNLYHFDCHFSGNDHGADWEGELKKLRAVGSNMEFFPYTEGTSSTRIKKLIDRETAQRGIYLFGAGARCGSFLSFLKTRKGYGNSFHVEAVLDNDAGKNLKEIDGVLIYSSDYMKFIKDKENTKIVITSMAREEIEKQLLENGFQDITWYEDYPGYADRQEGE